MKKAKTPLMAFIQKAYRIAVASKKKGAPPADELIDMANENHWSRRRFIENAGKAALITGIAGFMGSCQKDEDMKGFIDEEPMMLGGIKKKKSDVKIAIIGAGMAGLHALHILKKDGVENVTVFEGSGRAGGRIMSAGDGTPNSGNPNWGNRYAELGGEFIDSGHNDMLNLAAEFNLELLDTQSPSETALVKDAYFFNGQHRTLAQVVSAFQNIAGQMEADINSLSDEISFQESSPADQYFDSLSISEYLDNLGCTGWLKELLEVAYETEYGRSPDDQSCINMLYLISTDTTGGKFDIFGISDERYKVKGGNQQITDCIANLYPNSINLSSKLEAVDRQNDKYKLKINGSFLSTKYDYVIMTLPFTILKNIEFQFSLPSWKQNAIQNLGYGTNAKLIMGYTSRHWRNIPFNDYPGFSGYSFTDNGLQGGWDATQLQPGGKGLYTIYTGGPTGVNLGNGSPESRAAIYRPKLNQIFPGVDAKYIPNSSVRMHWPSFQWAKGSYACYRVGQWTTIAGAEGKKYQNLYFAGEHCSFDYQGYMNGAAHTGRKTAQKILNDLD